jgi:hypothetical protein
MSTPLAEALSIVQVMVTLAMFVVLTRQMSALRAARDVAEHARASADQIRAAETGIKAAYQPLLLRLDDQGREIMSHGRRLDALEHPEITEEIPV